MRYKVLVLLTVLFAVPAYAALDVKPSDAGPTLDVSATPETSAIDATDPVGIAKNIVGSFKNGQVRAGIAAIIMLLVFLWRRTGKFFSSKIPTKALPLVVAGVSLLASLPPTLIGTKFSIGSFLWDALAVSSQAVLFWSLLGKVVLPKILGSPPDKKASDAK